jgi:hypothetical protein
MRERIAWKDEKLKELQSQKAAIEKGYDALKQKVSSPLWFFPLLLSQVCGSTRQWPSEDMVFETPVYKSLQQKSSRHLADAEELRKRCEVLQSENNTLICSRQEFEEETKVISGSLGK